jgi:hypothetical protein
VGHGDAWRKAYPEPLQFLCRIVDIAADGLPTIRETAGSRHNPPMSFFKVGRSAKASAGKGIAASGNIAPDSSNMAADPGTRKTS